MKKMILALVISIGIHADDYDWSKKNPIQGKDFGIHGKLYDIKEKSILDEIFAKAKKVNWKKQLDAFNKSAHKYFVAKGNLPLCQETKIKKVKIINKLKYPLYNSKMEIIYPAGYEIDVLKTLYEKGIYDPKPMLFFNGNEVRQIEYAKLKQQKDDAHMYLIDGNIEELSSEIKNIYRGDLIMETMKVECTPSVYYQKDDHFEVLEIDNETLKKMIQKDKL